PSCCAARSAPCCPSTNRARGCVTPGWWSPEILGRAGRSTRSSMATKSEAYLDTSAFIAFVDRSDTHHERFRRLFSEPPSIVTTTLVIAEGHAWFLRRYDRTRALQFLALVDELKPLHILAVGVAELMGGAKLMRKYSDQDLTLT